MSGLLGNTFGAVLGPYDQRLELQRRAAGMQQFDPLAQAAMTAFRMGMEYKKFKESCHFCGGNIESVDEVDVVLEQDLRSHPPILLKSAKVHWLCHEMFKEEMNI